MKQCPECNKIIDSSEDKDSFGEIIVIPIVCDDPECPGKSSE
jgi:hypothetical protein